MKNIVLYEEVLSNWALYLKINLNYSDNTVSSYATDVKNLGEFLEVQDTIDTFKKVTLYDLREWLSSRQRNVRSDIRAISSIRSFFSYLKQCYDISNRAPFDIKIRNTGCTLPKSIKHSDIMKMLNILSTDNWVDLRDRAIMMLLYGCGLRITEALSLSCKGWSEDYVTVFGKNKKERLIPNSSIIKDSISVYIQACPYHINNMLFLGKRGAPLNRSVYAKHILLLRKRMGLSDSITPHAFRHSFATVLLNNGVGIRDIQLLLGHEDISSTDRYTSINTAYLFSEYTRKHPRI